MISEGPNKGKDCTDDIGPDLDTKSEKCKEDPCLGKYKKATLIEILNSNNIRCQYECSL